MIVTCVHVKVKPDCLDSFIEATVRNHKATLNEAGNLRFDLLQKEGDPARFMIYEAFESQEAADFHKTTAHYIAWRDEVKDYMADARMGVRYSVIEPGNREEW